MGGRRTAAFGGIVLIVLSLLSCKGSPVGVDEPSLPVGGDSQPGLGGPGPTGAAAVAEADSNSDHSSGNGSAGGTDSGEEVPGVSPPADPLATAAVVDDVGIPGVSDQPLRGPDLSTSDEPEPVATDQPPVAPESQGPASDEVVQPSDPGEG